MKKIIFFLLVTALITAVSLRAQDEPVISGNGSPVYPSVNNEYVLYDQMNDPGPNSYTSQNFETGLDDYDNQGADDFVAFLPLAYGLGRIEVLGVYYNGTGPAESVNVFFYSDSNGLPGSLVEQRLNVVPSGGLSTGSFVIPIEPLITFFWSNQTYWLSVQCNMDLFGGGQWGWTEHMPFNSPSAWRNPGGGFGMGCTNWDYRVANCFIGTIPYTDLSFRLIAYLIVPVELITFTVSVNETLVELNWITATETNNQGFSIERSSGSEFETIGFVAGFGTTTESKYYTFTDREVASGSYSYRLKQIDFDGTFEYSKVAEVEVSSPKVFALNQNYPNPFNPNTKINFSLAADSKVTMKVFNVLGQEVASLLNSNLVAGSHEVNFDASSLNSGVYMYRIEANGIDGTNFVDVKKMILTK